MKTTITLLIAFFFAGQLFANEMPNQTYYLLEGRQDQLENVKGLVNDINLTTYPVGTSPNTLMGDNFRLTFVSPEGALSQSTFHLSDQIIRKYKNHRQNGQTGEQILEVCGTQASQILVPIRAGANYFQQQTTTQVVDLTETNSRLARIENNQAGLADDHRVINDNLKVVDGKLDVIDQKLDRNYVAIDENTRQIKKARTEGWIQTGLTVGAVVVDGIFTRKYIKKHSGQQVDIFNTYKTYRTTNNTTTINNNGGGTGGNTGGPGHNPNGGGQGRRVKSFL